MLGLSLLRFTSKGSLIIGLFAVANVAAINAYGAHPSSWWFVLAFAVQAIVVTTMRARGRAEGKPWLDAARAGFVLEAPFAGVWMVAAGGPYRAGNHHIRASDQRYAYDFIRIGKSFDQPILAPCAGRIVAAHDGERDLSRSRNPDRVERGRELGNYVIVESGAAFVFLCHLREGSIAVDVGQWVPIGARLGRCGNSGRTMGPHLHIHAQDRAYYAFDEAIGLPIRFRSPNSKPRVLGKWSILRG